MLVDYVIIGQGLAGSLLAWELMGRGAKVIIVDCGKSNASRVAAGLINPVTGMRFVKGLDTDRQLQDAMIFYQRLKDHFGQSFYFKKPMLRIIRDNNELEYCKKRLRDNEYRHYFDRFVDPGMMESTVSAPFGGVLQKQTGYLSTRPLLNHLKEFFIEKNCYLETRMNYQDIKEEEKSVSWRNFEARMIVFCEGYQAMKNPWFSWLPFQPAKGEILTLTSQKALSDKILNYGNWLIPINQFTFRIGASFDRNNLDTLPTELGRKSLLESLSSVCPTIEPETTISHRANIRPTTLDKNPFIGFHPRSRKMAIFNGFGSKGSMLIPGYAIQFADYIENKAPLSETVDIQRHETTHFKD